MTPRLDTIALYWRIERRDGVTIGLTGHDRDLMLDGLAYRAAPGMTPSAVSRTSGLEADTMDVRGAFASAAITEGDLLSGRWDGAAVRVFAVDWESGAMIAGLGGGAIGAVETADGSFTAELRGPGAALDGPVCEQTSPECRAELGDKRCRVGMAGRTRLARVVSVSEAVVTLADAAEDGIYAFGRLRWLTGANCGLVQGVVASAGEGVTLEAEPVFAVAPGALVELVEGCDKSIATCAGRFGNAFNFRGEPYLPGIDLLTRYPGA